jgi:catecholate siderophore receptor
LPAQAGQVSETSTTTAEVSRARHRFEIPAGPLGDALAAFERTTGIRVDATASLGGIATPGAVGNLSAKEALETLLRGTGVSWRYTAPNVIAVELRRSEVVQVRAEAAPSSVKYTQPLRDIPQTLMVIPQEVIEEQGATTLRDVLQNVPGLTILAGEGGTPAGDNLTLRGFSARNDIFVDGVRDLGAQSRDPFNLEQVEVVKGPASAFTGRGSTGGSINLVSKSPLARAQYSGSLVLGSDATKRASVDVNQPLHGLGEGAAFRLNVMGHDADVAGRNAVTTRRWGVAPSLAFGIGTPTRVTLSYLKLDQDNVSDYGIPWVPANHEVLAALRDQPAPVPRETFYGFADRDRELLDANLATLVLERDLNAAFTLRGQARYGHTTRDSIATPPRFSSPDTTVINREMRAWLTEDDVWDGQVDLKGTFSTGDVAHGLVAGVSLSDENSIRRQRSAPNSPTTLLDPNPNDVYPGEITLSPDAGDLTGRSLAVYAFDTLGFGERFELTGGLRWDRFDVNGVTTAGLALDRVDELLSWRAAAVFKPRPNGSFYAAAGTALNPSLEALSYVGGGSFNPDLEPEKSLTVELGTKWDALGERLMVSAALFRVAKTNARTPGILPDDPPQVLEGEQRVTGVELGMSGDVTRDWRVFAAYTYMDSDVVESNSPDEIGNELPQTPPHSLSLWTTLRLPGDLSVGGAARFVGRRYNNVSNARSADAYWSFDAMASVPITERLELKLNVYNLTDGYYFDRVGGGHVVPAPGRSAHLAADFRF